MRAVRDNHVRLWKNLLCPRIRVYQISIQEQIRIISLIQITDRDGTEERIPLFTFVRQHDQITFARPLDRILRAQVTERSVTTAAQERIVR